MNFESRDFHNSHHIRIYGKRVLNSVPENSILLVTEDLNNNAIKYVQECEGVRPDVSSLSLPLMTYEWWSKTQKHHYPNVVIPNEMYHPGQSNGYSILEFLLSNMNASPIFIAGSWYVFFFLFFFFLYLQVYISTFSQHINETNIGTTTIRVTRIFTYDIHTVSWIESYLDQRFTKTC